MHLQIEKLDIQYHNSLSEILPIYNTDHGLMVKAKDLHQSLLIKQKYKDWIKDQLIDHIGYSYNDNDNVPDCPDIYNYISIKRNDKEVIYLSLATACEIAWAKLDYKDITPINSEIGKYLKELYFQYLIDKDITTDIIDASNTTDEEDKSINVLKGDLILLDDDINDNNKNNSQDDNSEIDYSNPDSLTEEELLIITNTDKENVTLLKNMQELIDKKDEEIDYLNGCIERLEDKNIQLEARIKHLTDIKVDGRALLNAFAAIDVQRRQKFVFGWKAKENAKINAYTFRKKVILDAGIVVNDENDNSKSFVDKISIDDMSKAVSVYLTALERIVNNSDTFTTLFGETLEKAKRYLNNIEFEQQQEEEIKQENIIDETNIPF